MKRRNRKYMSIAGDHKITLKNMIIKHSGSGRVVIDVFYETVTNEGWDHDYIIDFLESAKGINKIVDDELDKYIKIEKQYQEDMR